MATYRNWVSDIRSELKLTSGDIKITDRAIASLLRDVSIKLIKQQTDRRKLFFTDTLFTTLPCLELERVSITECCDFVSECYVARSVKKIPKIGENIHGLLYKGVFSIDYLGKASTVFTYMDVERYANIKRLYPNKEFKYFWIMNGYLYVSDPNIERVALSAYFEDPIDERYYDCNVDITKLCPINPLDLEFKCPGYLTDDVKSLVLSKLMNTYMKTPGDKTVDNKEDAP